MEEIKGSKNNFFKMLHAKNNKRVKNELYKYLSTRQQTTDKYFYEKKEFSRAYPKLRIISAREQARNHNF